MKIVKMVRRVMLQHSQTFYCSVCVCGIPRTALMNTYGAFTVVKFQMLAVADRMHGCPKWQVPNKYVAVVGVHRSVCSITNSKAQ